MAGSGGRPMSLNRARGLKSSQVKSSQAVSVKRNLLRQGTQQVVLLSFSTVKENTRKQILRGCFHFNC